MIYGHYNPALVALSILIAICASYTALNLATQTTAAAGRVRAAWLTGGAFSLGLGIWAMHYIGMLAFRLPVPVVYDLPIVLWSLFAACLASGVALYIVSRPRLNINNVIFGSLLMAVGICAMHYLGMAAMRLPASLHYNVWIVALSVLIAITVSSVALWIVFHLRRAEHGSGWLRIASAVIMGFAIASMHYTGMAAVCFQHAPMLSYDNNAVSVSSVGTAGIAGTTLLVLVMALTTGFVNRRFLLQERNLQLREQEIRLFFENNVAAVCRVSLDSRVLAANFHFISQLGYESESEVLGMDFRDHYCDPVYWPEVLPQIQQQKRICGHQVEYKDKHGQSRWKLVNYSLLENPGAPAEVLAISMDISDLKQAQEDYRRAKEKAEAASEAKSQFLAVMSHELRTPLNAILGLTGLVLDGDLSEEHRECLTMVRDSGETLLSIINDVLDFSKIEANCLELHPQTFSLRQLVLQSAKSLSVMAKDKPLTVSAEVHDMVGDHFVGDVQRLRQILVNLVGNAIKFTDKGQVVLRVEEETPCSQGVLVGFSVSDTGIGIPADKLQSVFESFAQVDSSTTRRFGGTGLGLTITRSLVTAMGGTIRADSREGQGSTFYFNVVLEPVKGSPSVDAIHNEIENEGLYECSGIQST